MNHDPAGSQKEARELARYASLGLQFGFTFLIFCGLGYAFDSWWETTPYGLLTGVLAGAGGASYSLYKATLPLETNTKQKGKDEKFDAH